MKEEKKRKPLMLTNADPNVVKSEHLFSTGRGTNWYNDYGN